MPPSRQLGQRRGARSTNRWLLSNIRLMVLVSVSLLVTATLWFGTLAVEDTTSTYGQSLPSVMERQKKSHGKRQLTEQPTARSELNGEKKADTIELQEEASTVAQDDRKGSTTTRQDDKDPEINDENTDAKASTTTQVERKMVENDEPSTERTVDKMVEKVSKTTVDEKGEPNTKNAMKLDEKASETARIAKEEEPETNTHAEKFVDSLPYAVQQNMEELTSQVQMSEKGSTAQRLAQEKMKEELLALQSNDNERQPKSVRITVNNNNVDNEFIGVYDDEDDRHVPTAEELRAEAQAAMQSDPLRSSDEKLLALHHADVDFEPAVPYLGVLIDAGRHYFPIPWLQRVMDRIANMKYNLVHLRLTDDQTFNVMLSSHPELAYPTAVDNPERAVYSVQELRNLTAYAKNLGIRIMPEINVPGHAGSWAGIPGLIVNCPEFACRKGYGMSLNVTHPNLRPILTDIIREVVDIFDDPPFLHLGGDEVNMAGPCFQELNEELFDYTDFEQTLKEILKDVGYPEEQVVRWEMTGQSVLDRAGKMEHFWESHPGDRHNATGPFLLSTWMYFDTNGDQDAFDVYSKALKSFRLKNGTLPSAIIAGTFELSTEFWYDRNILGRLLAVAFGAANMTFPGNKTQIREHINGQYRFYCLKLGFGNEICDTEGRPVIPTRDYRRKWQQKWTVWKRDMCERLASKTEHRVFRAVGSLYRTSTLNANLFFWNHFPMEVKYKPTNGTRPAFKLSGNLTKVGTHVVPHTGVILDTTSSLVHIDRLNEIITEHVAKLGFNFIQMRLASNNGFTVDIGSQPKLRSSLLVGNANPFYHLQKDLKPLVERARNLGIEVMPEVSVTTNSSGWSQAGLLANCPEHFCRGEGVPNNVHDPLLLPVVFHVLGELRTVFSSKYLHLGPDERRASAPCFEEAKQSTHFRQFFRLFEKKLTNLLTLNGMPPENILRYENTEHILYPGRTGNITQYRPGMDEIRTNETFFATVDVLDGDGWAIYRRTQELVEQKPLGILAELRTLIKTRWNSTEIPKRLIAFALGVSEMEPLSVDDFATTFEQVCMALGWGPDCTPPKALEDQPTYITDSEQFWNNSCEDRTYVATKYIVKDDIKPFYEATIQAKTS